MSGGEAHSCDEDGRDLTEFAAPSERSSLRMVRWEGAFRESIEDEAALEGFVQIIFERTVEIELGFGLVAEG